MIDVPTIIAAGATAGVGGWLLKAYQAKRTADSAELGTVVSTLVGLLSTEKAEHKTTRGELSAAQSNLELRSGQMGEFLGELKVVNDRLEEQSARIEAQASEIAELKAENVQCRSENRDLKARVAKLELERDPRHVTPPNDTPAVPRIDQLRPPAPPVMHESVGGYRHGKL